jgi:hypothetical protein
MERRKNKEQNKIKPKKAESNVKKSHP